MDLHPLNVLIGSRGPVVIDWTGASRGDPAIDVVIAWVLMSTGEIPGRWLEARLIAAARGFLVQTFVSCFDRRVLGSRLRDVVSWKVQDPHMSDQEVRAMWALVQREGASR
jgi:aminoglycoside phosphotransferase (APT) family kinase protein